MKLMESIGKFLGRTVLKGVVEAAMKFQASGWDQAREKEDKYWRGITYAERDLPSFKHDRMLKLAYWMWDMNPLAKRQIELMLDYMVGDGIEFDAPDKNVLDVLKKFWEDPVNNWDLRQDDRFRELSLTGEQVYVPFVNKSNGHVRMGIIDPQKIQRIEADKDNPEVLKKVILSVGSGITTIVKDEMTGEEKEVTKTELDIISVCSDPTSEDFGRLVGDCFLFQINRPSNATRGRSDLLANIDWLDAYDRFLFAALEIEELKRRIMFHMKLENANPKAVKEKREYLQDNPVPPGGFYVSDEKETIQDFSPDLRSGDLKTSSDVYKAQIYAGAGFPKHMFGVGDDVNRATAQSMTEPVIRSVMRRQKYVKFMIGQIFTYVIQQAQKYGRLKAKDTTYTVTLPDPSPKETLLAADALASITASMVTAKDANLISSEQARSVYQSELAKLGIVTEETEAQKKQEEEEEDEEAKEGEKAYAGKSQTA